jgi:hypothetical protein
MHIVFQMNELARLICEHVLLIMNAFCPPCDRSCDTTQLACIEKGLSNIAFDVFWEDVPAAALLHIFPSEVVGLNEAGEKVRIEDCCTIFQTSRLTDQTNRPS